MRLLAIGFAIVAIVIALAVLFYKVDRMDDKIEEAARPRIHLLADSGGEQHVLRADRRR